MTDPSDKEPTALIRRAQRMARLLEANETVPTERVIAFLHELATLSTVQAVPPDAMLASLKVVQQGLLEMHHAHFNPGWFTKGNGATQQFLTWHRKADEALDSAIALAAPVEKLVAAARSQALEEAAQACDRRTMALDHAGNEYWREAPASQCAAAIRKLAAAPLQGADKP